MPHLRNARLDNCILTSADRKGTHKSDSKSEVQQFELHKMLLKSRELNSEVA
jgi:hypothetical protein